MVKPLASSRNPASLLLGLCAILFAGPSCQSEEYVFNLPLKRSVTQLEKGEPTYTSSKPAPKGGPLFASNRRIIKIGEDYFDEFIFEDGQIIKREVKLLGRTDEQIWFYLPGQPAPRLVVFSFLSKSVVIAEIASFPKERGDWATKSDFTEAVLEYGNFTFKK
jgi:hypothetical protein